jgi:hypothetical protein
VQERVLLELGMQEFLLLELQEEELLLEHLWLRVLCKEVSHCSRRGQDCRRRRSC